MKFIKKNIKLIIGIIVGMLLVSSLSVYATMQYQASQVEYKDGKSVEEALNDLYTIKNDTSTIAYFSSVFDGAVTSYRNVNLVERNENYTEIVNNDLYITKKGTYKAYLSVAFGSIDGYFGSCGDLFVDGVKTASCFFDRVAGTNTNAITAQIEVKENERKKIEYKVIQDQNYSNGNAAVTASLVIVKIA